MTPPDPRGAGTPVARLSPAGKLRVEVDGNGVAVDQLAVPGRAARLGSCALTDASARIPAGGLTPWHSALRTLAGQHPAQKGGSTTQRTTPRDYVITTSLNRSVEPDGSFSFPEPIQADPASGGSADLPVTSPTQCPTHPETRPRKLRRRNWKPAFLDAYRETGIVSKAAAAAGVDRTTVYAATEKDPGFAVAWTAADEDFVDTLEGELIQRALTYSDRLLEFALKNRRPRVYGSSYNLRAEIRAEIARVADKLGISFDEVLEAATRRAEELGR